jgi:omega-amidase
MKYFDQYCESIPNGETTRALSEIAKTNKIILIGGSIVERDGSNLYNTCCVFDNEGQLIAKHRKVHLFDINMPGTIVFEESSKLSAGNSLTVFETSNHLNYI